ncbi:thioredoxin family protein [Flavicella marina]|uniref:thioredoxin family protein n=1 Tax=Flavicella marina TaxID=1475951 RepID=UPI00126438D4|nr:thioredoxin fold domain-containing protein [Flavicella marina]
MVFIKINTYIFSTLLLLLVGLSSNAQQIQWIGFEEAIAKSEKEPKNILIDIYTDWCGYCKKMDQDTYRNNAITDIINENFYAVKLNAEQKKSIYYKGKEYKYINNGRRGYHELAASILHGKMSYPTTVFMDKNGRFIQKIPGYLDAETIEPILVYFGEERHLEESWETFLQEYSSKL